MPEDQVRNNTLLTLNNNITMSTLHNDVARGKAPRGVAAGALVFDLLHKFNEYSVGLGLNGVDLKDFGMGSYDSDSELKFSEAKRLLYAQYLFSKQPKLGMLFISTYVFMPKYTLGTKLFSLGEDTFWMMVQWLIGFLGKSVGSGHSYLCRPYLIAQTDTFVLLKMRCRHHQLLIWVIRYLISAGRDWPWL